ncbi:type III restriction-modification system EcoP15I enzyme mod [Neisseria flavescens]|uniref:hypothetical protein n=1 Tax=Neisseria flavescens TaxID=484 RepID=UPI0007A83F7C|nr:hypothetical protein [Neisseria flavescens]KZC86239.1 type III restriction-modification system EcoP15I enzyme mod [Neisseria flavescens]
MNIDSVLSETSSENLLYELMLRMGLKLTCKISFSDDVYFVEDEDTGGLYAFLLERVDQGLIDAVLAKHPIKVAALDRLRPLQKSPSPDSRNPNTGFRLFPLLITPDFTQISP